jgi:DNA polymerase III epsilon subunit-like protein
MYYFAFDTETTGLEYKVFVAKNTTKHEIIQLGALILDSKLREIASGQMRLMPERWEDAEPQALKINGADPKTWEPTYKSTKEALTKLDDWITKHVPTDSKIEIMGHNVPFDYGFLEPLLRKHDIPVRFGYHPLDTISWYQLWGQVMGERINSFKLKSACNKFGIEFGGNGAHDAMADIRATAELARAIRDSLRSAIKSGGRGLKI